VEGKIHDALLLHHAIHPELPHNLGYIVSIYGQTPYWKDGVLSRDGSLASIPDERLRLIFACCHPALELKSRVALTLRPPSSENTSRTTRVG
jgi:hypothetical protein